MTEKAPEKNNFKEIRFSYFYPLSQKEQNG